MMCGGFARARSFRREAFSAFPAATASASIQPSVESCDSEEKPERTKLETWLMPWNGSQGCSGTLSDIPPISARQAVPPSAA